VARSCFSAYGGHPQLVNFKQGACVYLLLMLRSSASTIMQGCCCCLTTSRKLLTYRVGQTMCNQVRTTLRALCLACLALYHAVACNYLLLNLTLASTRQGLLSFPSLYTVSLHFLVSLWLRFSLSRSSLFPSSLMITDCPSRLFSLAARCRELCCGLAANMAGSHTGMPRLLAEDL
jgi:hypothetical protein